MTTIAEPAESGKWARWATLISTLGTDQAAADARRTAGSLHRVPAVHAEVLDAACDPETGHTTAWFVFDFVILHWAQSGSDWYYHHVFAGSATIFEDKIIDATLVRLREDNVTEFEMEWAPADERYDSDRVRSADRDAWWAKVLAARAGEGRP